MAARAEESDREDASNARTPRVTRAQRPLKVLIISHAFPPVNVIGAVRVGKFAKYLHEGGHDVRVVAAPREGDQSLALEIPADRVVYEAGWEIDGIFDGLVKPLRRWWRGTLPAAPHPDELSTRPTTGLTAALTRHYYALLRVPDARAGWIGAATLAGCSIARDWRPDVVFASAPPNSALIAGHRIARACGVPWVAELRDLWVDNSYYSEPLWRLWVDRLLERRALSSAAGLVTVTLGWAEALRRRYRQPISCIFNGYVAEDFPAQPSGPPPGDVVSIVYTGTLYSGDRDPSALFSAINLLGAERDRVVVHFYGPPREQVQGFAMAHGVVDRVFVHDPVSYKACLALQTSADILLLLQWNPKQDEGHVPAKLFEYLGARRPILLLGYEHGEPAEIIRKRGAGFVADDPPTIARQLRTWIAQRPTGIPPIDPRAREGLSRAEQFFKLEQFLTAIVVPE